MKKPILILALALFSAILLFCVHHLWQHFRTERQSRTHFTELAQLIQATPDDPNQPDPAQVEESQHPIPARLEEPNPYIQAWALGRASERKKAPSRQQAASTYDALLSQNPDMVGWVSIEGTSINYPVMQTPENPNFYLNHDFKKRPSKHGVPFLFGRCNVDPQSDNLIIYGHHMKSGAMFGTLNNYKKKSFYQKHPFIRFDTLAGSGKYEIFAVFAADADTFPYGYFTEAQNQAEFDGYVSYAKGRSYYDIQTTVEYGDKLLTLVTCEYSGSNNRLMVVAKKI